MPTSDYSAILGNCSNGFARDAKYWVLGRLLRDHITRYPVDARSEDEGGRAESIRIDNFALDPITTSPACDLVWWSGWAILLVQIGIAIAPWVLFGDWGVMMVALCGNGLAAITCAMPQWTEEKWSGRTLQRDKVICLTGGNGHHHGVSRQERLLGLGKCCDRKINCQIRHLTYPTCGGIDMHVWVPCEARGEGRADATITATGYEDGLDP